MRRPTGGKLFLLRVFLAVLAVLVFAAGVTATSGFAAESCEEFVKAFRSVPLAASQMPAIHDFQGPWPAETYPLEAGYGEGCDIGEMAEIVALCPDAKTYPLIKRTPVIASDPEGFTVVMIGRDDHEQLQDEADVILFYAKCR